MLRYVLLAVVIPFILYAYIVATGYDGIHYLRGDCPYYYVTALSLYADHDLDLSNELRGDFLVHNGSVSISKDRKLVPKHPIIMPMLAMPLIIALGPPGALAFNLIQVAVLLFLTFVLAMRFASPRAAAVAVILTGVATFIPHYVWNFSSDLFSAALLVAALVALPPSAESNRRNERLFLSGFLFALTVVSKFSLFVFLPGILLICPAPRLRNLLILSAGGFIPFLCFAIFNNEMFGSPFTTSYHRIAVLDQGRIVPYSQENDFNLPFREGLYLQMFDRDKGLFFTSPLTLLSLLGLPLLGRRNKSIAFYIGLSSLLLYLFFCTYRLWNQSHYGNRFLMVIIFLGAVPLASLLDHTARNWKRRAESP